MQGGIYAGVPAANTAFKRTAALLAELGLQPPPAPLMKAARPRRHTTFSQPQLAAVLQGDGDKAPVLMAHSLGLSEVIWEGLAERLAALGHPTLRYDLRGHGRSACPSGDWGLAELAADAARLIQEWGRGPVVMIGLSLGGLVAQQLAASRPDLLQGLVLAHCDSHYPEAARAVFSERIAAVRAQGMRAVIEPVLARYLHPALRAARPDLEAGLRELLRSQDPEGYARCCAAVRDADLRGALSAWSAPTLVIGGRLDGGVPPERIQALAASLPQARLCMLEAASHLGPVEQPPTFEEAVVAFLGDR